MGGEAVSERTVTTGGGAAFEGDVENRGLLVGRDQRITVNVTWQAAPFAPSTPDLARLLTER